MSKSTKKRKRRQLVIGPADLEPGDRRIIEVDGKAIGLFNIDGKYYALHNRCPHMAGNLCQGPITGTALYTNKTEFKYGMDGEIVRCGWHGWEFEIKTGQCLVDRRIRARSYRVTVIDGQLFIHI